MDVIGSAVMVADLLFSEPLDEPDPAHPHSKHSYISLNLRGSREMSHPNSRSRFPSPDPSNSPRINYLSTKRYDNRDSAVTRGQPQPEFGLRSRQVADLENTDVYAASGDDLGIPFDATTQPFTLPWDPYDVNLEAADSEDFATIFYLS